MHLRDGFYDVDMPTDKIEKGTEAIANCKYFNFAPAHVNKIYRKNFADCCYFLKVKKN